MLLLTVACSTKPSVVPPIPSVCFEACSVNQCRLEASYEALDEEAKADAELRCTRENADSARFCAALKSKCAEGLKSR
jgi:hypothetical protein